MQKPSYQVVGLGGTFDHFHDGHATFLNFAANQGRHLKIGITDEKLTLHKKWAASIQPYATRAQAVAQYCYAHNISHEIFRLTDIYGPTIEKSEIQALVVTEATIGGAQAINSLRLKLNLRALPVHVCNLLRISTGETLSSTLIRAGKCNRSGIVYSDFIKNDFVLTPEHKAFFHEPQGKLVKQPTSPLTGVTTVVGDTCLTTFLTHNWPYTLGVFDRFTERAPANLENINTLQPDLKIKNKAGEISLQLIKELQKITWKKKLILEIEGEEDLTTVALVLLMPLQSHIYYGQPGKGMIEIKVTEQQKAKFWQVFNS